ncbi:hypothetical protein T01_6954 [Trichinella spiralis]|uniref:Uncharacterized protein n=1 Tax=Trichinella spiralis TaxID=6334 RepID=A0A0V1C080_TRISP|nr:hypothetical protein T01_6954 [Trichinella spiralis]
MDGLLLFIKAIIVLADDCNWPASATSSNNINNLNLFIFVSLNKFNTETCVLIHNKKENKTSVIYETSFNDASLLQSKSYPIIIKKKS